MSDPSSASIDLLQTCSNTITDLLRELSQIKATVKELRDAQLRYEATIAELKQQLILPPQIEPSVSISDPQADTPDCNLFFAVSTGVYKKDHSLVLSSQGSVQIVSFFLEILGQIATVSFRVITHMRSQSENSTNERVLVASVCCDGKIYNVFLEPVAHLHKSIGFPKEFNSLKIRKPREHTKMHTVLSFKSDAQHIYNIRIYAADGKSVPFEVATVECPDKLVLKYSRDYKAVYAEMKAHVSSVELEVSAKRAILLTDTDQSTCASPGKKPKLAQLIVDSPVNSLNMPKTPLDTLVDVCAAAANLAP